MKCNLRVEDQRDLRVFVGVVLRDMVQSNEPFDLNKLTKQFYDLVMERDQDEARALEHAMLVPLFVSQIKSLDINLSKYLREQKLDLNALEDINLAIADKTSSIEDIRKSLGLLPNTISSETVIDEVIDNTPEETVSIDPAFVEQVKLLELVTRLVPFQADEFAAIPRTALTSKSTEAKSASKGTRVKNSNEIIPNPEYNVPTQDAATVLVSKVVRKVVQALGQGSAEFKGSNLDLDGKGPVYLTLMKSESIADDLRLPGKISSGLVLVFTNVHGEPVQFNETTGERVYEKGKAVYFNSLRDEARKSDIIAALTRSLGKNEARKSDIIAALTRSLGKNENAEAIATIQINKEFALLKQMQDAVLNDNQIIINDIDGGSLGYILEDFSLKTPLSKIAFDQPFNPWLPSSNIVEHQGLSKERTYFTVDSVYQKPLVIERPAIAETDIVEKLINLLIQPLVQETATGKIESITTPERFKIAQQFFNFSSDTIRIFENKNGRFISIVGKNFELATPEQREVAKSKLLTYFNTVAPIKQIKKSDIGKAKVILTSTPNYTSLYTQAYGSGRNVVLEVPAKKDEQGNVIYPARYYRIDKAKLNFYGPAITSNSYTTIDSVEPSADDSGNFILKTSKQTNYADFVKQYGYTRYELNAENKLVRLNPYVTFTPLHSQESKFIKEDVAQAIIAKADAVEVPTSELTGPNVLEEESIDSILKRIRDNKSLQKSLDVKQTDLRATTVQIEQAQEWYKGHPLSKYFPFKALFDVVNKQNPKAAATWTMNGITLFKGSDYSDLYHEAWHGFSQGFLNAKQKKELYAEAAKKNGHFKDYGGRLISFKYASELQLEEYLAEDFRRYMLSGQKVVKTAPIRNSIFRKIFDFLKTLFGELTVNEVVQNDRANQFINEIYEKLRVGNLSEWTFAQKNAEFGLLNTGLRPFTKESTQEPLNYQDSMRSVRLMDSIFSELVDLSNSGLLPSEINTLSQLRSDLSQGLLKDQERKLVENQIKGLESKRTYNFTSTLFRNQQGLKDAYQYAYIRLSAIQNSLNDKLNTMDDIEERIKIEDSIRIVNTIRTFYGDYKNLNNNKTTEKGDVLGMIAYHGQKSSILSPEIVEAVFEEDNIEEDKFNQDRDGYERTGNSTSMKDLAGKDVISLLSTLYRVEKVNSNGEVTYATTEFGVPDLILFKDVWNRLVRTLAGKTADQMEQILLKEQSDYLPFKQLLSKIGPLNTGSSTEYDLWTQIWRTFNLTNIRLIQFTVDQDVFRNEDTLESSVSYNTTVGEATGNQNKIGRIWLNEFKTDRNNPYAFYNEYGPYLNTNLILSDFAENLANNRLEFFQALGLNLSNMKEIKESLKKDNAGGAEYFYKKLKALNANDIKVRTFEDIIKEQKLKSGELVKELSSLDTRFKELLKLEIRYSERNSSGMVSNASGNSQSEYSLNSSLSQIINKLNDPQIIDYKYMIANHPELSHFDVKRDPFKKSSRLLNSIFKMDLAETDAEYGKRRRAGKFADSPFVQLELTNLSGTLFTKNGEATENGIESAKSDPFTKLVTDLHLMLSPYSRPETLRHSDKTTSYSIAASHIYNPTTGSFQDKFLPVQSFFSSAYQEESFTIIVPYINAELQRIKVMRNSAANGLDKNYDQGYVKRGKEFVYFNTILSQKTKDALLDYDSISIETLPIELKSQISDELNEYFGKQVDSLYARYNQAPFIGTDLFNTISGDAANRHFTGNITKVMLQTLVYNTWINNYEMTAMFYGDLALYKEGSLHKRIAGLGSTGLLFRTDKISLDFINTNMGRDYAKKQGITYEPFNGRMASAVIADKKTTSAYIKEYERVLGEKGAVKYREFEESDAMGYISFDSYRILKKSQNQWLPAHELLYQQIINGKTVNPQLVKDIFFPTMKAQYYGPLEGTSLPLTAFHKFQLFPLVPTVIENSPVLMELHDKMTREQVDYVLFQSGSKVSTITKDGTTDTFYNANRQVSTEPFTKNVIFVDYLKDQLEIAPAFKEKVTFPSQLRALIELGLMQNGVPIDFKGTKEAWEKVENKELESTNYRLIKEFENNVEALTKLKTKQLLQKANWSINDKGEISGEIGDLIKFLKKELERLDMADHEIDFLAEHNGNVKFDLSIAPFAEKLEKALNNIVAKELINQKVNGEGLVQVTGAMFEQLASQNRDYTNPTKEDLKEWGSDDLPTYHQPDMTDSWIDFMRRSHPSWKAPKGYVRPTAAMKVKIALQGDFKKLLTLKDKEGKRIGNIKRLNQLIKDEEWLAINDNRKLITMTAVRIPTQGLNSMEFMEVYEFLPEIAGNIIVVPAEIVAKSGSDFDIDKLTVLMPNIALVNGQAELYKSFSVTESEESLKVKRNEASDKIKAINQKYDSLFDERKTDNDFKFTESEIAILKEINQELRTLDEDITEQTEIFSRTRLVLAEEKLFDLEYQKQALEANRSMYISEFSSAKAKAVNSKREAELEPHVKALTVAQRSLNALSSKAIENNLLYSIKSILELPSNYEALIRPNDTDIAMDVVDYMKSKVDDYKGLDTVSSSDLLSYEGNLDVHNTNNSSKSTLPIGAVGNKWNPLFNRVGAHLNPTAGLSTEKYNEFKERQADKTRKSPLTKEELTLLNKYHRQALFLPHHFVKIGNEKGISISELKDVKGEHTISTIIDQLMNGWVDVANDPWVFFVQGNQQVTPTLEFLIEAGVPFKTAVIFASTPLVRAYVKELQLAGTTLAEAFGKNASSRSKIRAKAIAAIINNPAYEFNKHTSEKESEQLVRTLAAAQVNEEFKVEDLEKLLNETENISDLQRNAFLHFLEAEEMGGAMRDIKTRLNADTKRAGSFFEAENKISLKQELQVDARWPEEVINKIINDSPIKSFFIHEFQLEIWKKLFPLRLLSNVSEFLNSEFRQTDIENTFGKREEFVNGFRNSLVSYIFQNSLAEFNLDTVSSFRGMSITTNNFQTEMVTITDAGISINKVLMIENFSTSNFSDKTKVENRTFTTSKEYFKFILEREYLRHTNPFETTRDKDIMYDVKMILEGNKIKPLADEESAGYEVRVEKEVYELYLRDKALDNINNMWKLFNSNESYAMQFITLRNLYEDDLMRYELVKNLGISESKTRTNLQLNETKLEGDTINLYHENLLDLANPQVKKLALDEQGNKVISEFFARFSTVAMLQSGLSTGNSMSLVRLIPTNTYVQLVDKASKVYMRYIENLELGATKVVNGKVVPDLQKRLETSPILNDLYTKFVSINSDYKNRLRGGNYQSHLNLNEDGTITSDSKISEKIITEHKTTVEAPIRTLYEGLLNTAAASFVVGKSTLSHQMQQAFAKYLDTNPTRTEAQELLDKWKELKSFNGNPNLTPGQETLLKTRINKLQDLSGTSSQTKPKALDSYTMFSGDASGSDKGWALIGKQYGLGKAVNYIPATLQKLSPLERVEVENAYQQAVKDLGRRMMSYNWDAPTKEDYSGGLVRRDYLQAKAADAVFAIGNILNPGQLDKSGKYFNKSENQVIDGETAYAVQMAINLGKPVYVFDQVKGKWFAWNNDKFIEVNTPKLTPKFAGIGTRELTDAGRQAIREVYQNTLTQGNVSKEATRSTANVLTSIVRYAQSQLDENGKERFKDGRYLLSDSLYLRQSDYVTYYKGEEPKAANDNMTMGAAIGNFVDIMSRDLFAGITPDLKMITEEANVKNKNVTEGQVAYKTEVSQEIFEKLLSDMVNVKNSLASQGFQFYSNNLLLKADFAPGKSVSQVSNVKGIAGALDLVAHNPVTDELFILDFKNLKYRDDNGFGYTATNVFGIDATSRQSEYESKVASWGNQLSVYKALLDNYGLNVTGVYILPVSAYYIKSGNTLTLQSDFTGLLGNFYTIPANFKKEGSNVIVKPDLNLNLIEHTKDLIVPEKGLSTDDFKCN